MYGYLSDSMVFLVAVQAYYVLEGQYPICTGFVARYRHCVEYKNGTHTISPNVNINPSPSGLGFVERILCSEAVPYVRVSFG
jgi:hypothetical protein